MKCLLLPLLLAASTAGCCCCCCSCLWQLLLLLLSHNSPLVTNQRPLVADFLLLPPDPLLLLLLLFTSVCSFSSSPCCPAPTDIVVCCCCCCFIKSNFAFISFDYCQRFPFFPSIISSRFFFFVIKKWPMAKNCCKWRSLLSAAKDVDLCCCCAIWCMQYAQVSYFNKNASHSGYKSMKWNLRARSWYRKVAAACQALRDIVYFYLDNNVTSYTLLKIFIRLLRLELMNVFRFQQTLSQHLQQWQSISTSIRRNFPRFLGTEEGLETSYSSSGKPQTVPYLAATGPSSFSRAYLSFY